MPGILDISIRSLSFVSTLENSFGVTKPRLGRNAIGAYSHYRTLAPHLPDSFRDMEPLFLAVICGCNAGLFREALHEVYIPRVQRGNASFAAKVLGARAALLSVLAHFFEHGRWGFTRGNGYRGEESHCGRQAVRSPTGGAIIATRGFSAPEARICYECVESLCHSLNEAQIDGAFCEAMRIAREQESISLTKRAEGTYAEYRGQKASGLGGRGFRLPLC